MRHDFYLAFRYLSFHRKRTAILIACLSLMATLPVGLHQLLDVSERQMTARAEATPLLVGAKGSALDLAMNTLYFTEATPTLLTMTEADRVTNSGWADPLPVYARYRVRGHPLVGVTLDYFDYRGLRVAQGESMSLLGQCLLGAQAAESLRLKPGDSLLTMPENLFDLAGVFPLKLHVAGILARTQSADDTAVFVDLQTAWVIEGLGHGHDQPSAPAQNRNQPFSAAGMNRVADPKLLNYTEITSENLDSFHFHGDPSSYPISAVIALPHDRRAATLLKGRYLDPDLKTQIIQPSRIIRKLMDQLFRIRTLFDAVIAMVGGATLLALGLVFSLSLRLRQAEIHTNFLLGCSPWTTLRLLIAELSLLTGVSALICITLMALLQRFGSGLVQQFFLS
jgi:putative ABC transport system permease protein